MAERPILFSGPMVRAILEGRKTQTRRVVKCPHIESADVWSRTHDERGFWEWGIYGEGGQAAHGDYVRCPYGQPGDVLWVRETWRTLTSSAGGSPIEVQYRAGGIEERRAAEPCGRDIIPSTRGPGESTDPLQRRWRSPIHMPRWASRLSLLVKGVRVERVQEISEDDARAEGFRDADARGEPCSARTWFSVGWDELNAKRGFSFDRSPWVWVVEFERLPAAATQKGGG